MKNMNIGIGAASLFILWAMGMGCAGHFQKIKSAGSLKKSVAQESTIVSQMALLKSQMDRGMLLQNDSSNFWLWFESADPFSFHPDKGLIAEKGELLLGANQRNIQLKEENRSLLESEWKDSSSSEKLKQEEKEEFKNLEKTEKRNNWLFGLLIVALLFFLKTVVEKFFCQASPKV